MSFSRQAALCPRRVLIWAWSDLERIAPAHLRGTSVGGPEWSGGGGRPTSLRLRRASHNPRTSILSAAKDPVRSTLNGVLRCLIFSGLKCGKHYALSSIIASFFTPLRITVIFKEALQRKLQSRNGVFF